LTEAKRVTGPRNPFAILLLEDNPGDVELLRMALDAARLPYELSVIDDGARALEFVRLCSGEPSCAIPNLAILDLDLPKHDGLTILEAIRSSSRLSGLPVVVLTSSPNLRELARLQSLGIARHLVKPSDLDAYLGLGAIIGGILRQSAGGED
jgi:two-component system response regulator